MPIKLFDGSDSEEEPSPEIKINEEFARRYEHNKKREDLQRLEELKKRGEITDSEDDESSSEEEDEEDELEDLSKNDAEFFEVLKKVKNRDPSLKDKDLKLFNDEDEDENVGEIDEEEKKKKKLKPMYLKDVVAKNLLENGPEFDEEGEGGGKEKKLSYFEEQEKLRNEFLDTVKEMDAEEGEGDDGDEFLKVRKVDNAEEEDDPVVEKLNDYFGEDDKLDENERFLKDYFREKKWLEKDEGVAVDDLDVSEDEEELEKQEDYEREFNFRFEEDAGDRVLGHSRVIEDSVRKKNSARKNQRISKAERKAQEEFERKEELKRLKNVKKKEISEKLKKIKETAGIGDKSAVLLDEHDLEKEFDPEEYDEKMRKAFDDDYYEADDVDPGFGSDMDEDGDLEKPDFDKEDELLGLPKGWDDVDGSGDGFKAVRERKLKRKVGDDVKGEVANEEEAVSEEGSQKKKKKLSKLEKEVIKKELEEYYKLDYEDTIGDLKTRFKYRPVNPKSYGLSAKEILLADEKDLNQLVSLKKIAPYREKEWNVPRSKIIDQKSKIKAVVKGETSKGHDAGKKKTNEDGKVLSQSSANTNGEERPSDVGRDQSGLSKKAKRKLRQADLKLSSSRLLAYGKISSKTKSKKKH